MESQDSAVTNKLDSAMFKCSSVQKQTTLNTTINHHEIYHTIQNGTHYFYNTDIATMHLLTETNIYAL